MGKRYRVLDLFSGLGGFSYGFELTEHAPSGSTFELVCAVDSDPWACETLALNLSSRGSDPAIVMKADLTDPETHQAIVDRCKGGVDLIIGGPPCQSFSSIGVRSAATPVRAKWTRDDRDSLYLEYVTLIDDLRPKFLVLENVKGIITKRDESGCRFIDLVAEAISQCGYRLDIGEHGGNHVILNAADYGVPQVRERVFLLANNLDLPNPTPAPTHSKDGDGNTLPYLTIRDALGDLPILSAPFTTLRASDKRRRRAERFNERRYRGVESVPYDWDTFYSHYNTRAEQGRRFLEFVRPKTEDAHLTAHVARGHQLSDQSLFRRMRQGTTSKDVFISTDEEIRRLKRLVKYDMNSFLDKYRKQHWDRPCTTIFAHMQKDGNRFIHPDSSQARTFTVREAARLQSFPDDFVFAAPGNIRYRLIGNAVPPLLARAIAESILAALDAAGLPDRCPSQIPATTNSGLDRPPL